MRAEELKEKTKKLFGKKGFGFAFIGFFAGLMLLILPADSKAEDPKTPDESFVSSTEYCKMLEEKAAELICELPEVDDCRVFITLEKGYRYVYATDQHVRENGDGKDTDKTIVLAGNGSGESPILIEETMPSVAGVAIVCRGASYETQYRIIELICALFDIKSNRISVQT